MFLNEKLYHKKASASSSRRKINVDEIMKCQTEITLYIYLIIIIFLQMFTKYNNIYVRIIIRHVEYNIRL